VCRNIITGCAEKCKCFLSRAKNCLAFARQKCYIGQNKKGVV